MTPTKPLPEGPIHVDATATDAAGNTSQPGTLDLTIDTTAPDYSKLAITGVLDNVGDITGNVKNGGETDDTHPVISGTGTAGDIVTVYTKDSTGNHVIGSATVGADGTWSLKPELPLVSGLNALTAVETDPAGNATVPSAPYNVTVDVGAPAAPAIVSVYDDVGPYVGFLQKGAVTDDNQPTFSGTAQPGSTVKLYDSNGLVIGSGATDASGNWTITTDKLADGLHNITATATNSVGTESAHTGIWPLTVDTGAPANTTLVITDDVGPVTGPLHNGDTTDDNQPTFSGQAEPGGKVIVYDDGKQIGEADVDPSGNWEFTPTTPLVDGPHDFSTEVLDPAGNSSGQGNPTHITIDTSGVIVSITHVIDDVGSITGDIALHGVTDDTRPDIVGTGKVGAIVTIKDGDTVLGSTTVDASGNWSFTPSSDLAEGKHSIIATAVDLTGSTGSSSVFDFTVDTTAPAKPTIDQVYDDVGSIQGPIPNGGVTDDSTPTLSGKAEPGSTVAVYDNGEKLGSVTADPSGNWEFTPTTPISEGPHAFTVDATDKAGNTSPTSDPFSITTDYTAPTAPVITGVLDSVGEVTGNVSNGDQTDDSRPVISGTGTAGDLIVVSTTDSTGTHVLGSTTVAADGTWKLQPSTPLVSGSNAFTAVETDPAGNTSVPSNTYSIDLISTPPAAPVIVSVLDDVGPYTGFLQKGDVTDDNQPTFSGTAQPGSVVKLYDTDNTLIGSGTTDAKGVWTITTDPLADGLHNVTATATNSIGQVSAPTGIWPFTVDTTAPANTTLVITDDVGPVTGPLHNGDTTDDNQPTFSGQAEPGGKVIVYDNGQPIGSAAVDPSGNWEFTPTTPLVDGPHDFSTEVLDPAGNSSGQGSPTHIIIDTSGVIVSITHVIDDVGSITGDIALHGVTDDARPDIVGTGKAGAIVTIKDGDTVLGSTTIDAKGNWSFTPSSDLAEGLHNITATAVDLTGNTGSSSVFDFTVDTTAPAKPTIDQVYDDVGDIQGPIPNGGVTDDSNPTLSGKAEPGSTVTVYDNGQPLGSVTADHYKQVGVGVRGSVVAHPGGINFSQNQGETLAVLEAKGAEGATINSNVGAKVAGNGYAVVGGLTPYRQNSVEIDPKGTSKDVELQVTSQTVAPRYGSVVMLKYPTVSGAPVLMTVTRDDGQGIPLGAEVLDTKGNSLSMVGQGSRIFLRGLEPKGELLVKWGEGSGQRCQINYQLPENSNKDAPFLKADATCHAVLGTPQVAQR